MNWLSCVIAVVKIKKRKARWKELDRIEGIHNQEKIKEAWPHLLFFILPIPSNSFSV
jgi:hypothetical protein